MNNNFIYYHLKPCAEIFYVSIGNSNRLKRKAKKENQL